MDTTLVSHPHGMRRLITLNPKINVRFGSISDKLLLVSQLAKLGSFKLLKSITLMPKIKTYIFLPLLILLISCSASGPLYQAASAPTNGKSLVYIYRPDVSYALGGRSAYIFIDGKDIVHLDRGGYTYAYIDSGSHLIKQKWPLDLIGFKDSELSFNAEANKSYYFKFWVDGACPEDTYNKMCWRWILEQVPEDLANIEISTSHFQPSK